MPRHPGLGGGRRTEQDSQGPSRQQEGGAGRHCPSWSSEPGTDSGQECCPLSSVRGLGANRSRVLGGPRAQGPVWGLAVLSEPWLPHLGGGERSVGTGVAWAQKSLLNCFPQATLGCLQDDSPPLSRQQDPCTSQGRQEEAQEPGASAGLWGPECVEGGRPQD